MITFCRHWRRSNAVAARTCRHPCWWCCWWGATAAVSAVVGVGGCGAAAIVAVVAGIEDADATNMYTVYTEKPVVTLCIRCLAKSVCLWPFETDIRATYL